MRTILKAVWLPAGFALWVGGNHLLATQVLGLDDPAGWTLGATALTVIGLAGWEIATALGWWDGE